MREVRREQSGHLGPVLPARKNRSSECCESSIATEATGNQEAWPRCAGR